MKRSKISKSIDYIEEDLIADAIDTKSAAKAIRTHSLWRGIGVAAAASVVLVAGGIVISQVVGKDALPMTGTSNTVIALDVNPSMEIELTSDKNVVEVRALNEDAETVLSELDLANVTLEVAIDEIISSMWAQEYLSDTQNSILISVSTLDSLTAEELKDSVLSKVESFFTDKETKPCVITQSFEKTDSSNAIAQKNDISIAKATLIQKIVDAKLADIDGVPYSEEELAAMNVNELKLLLDRKAVQVEGLGGKGEPSAKKYITAEAALVAAYEHAQVVATDVVEYEVELEFDKRTQSMFYEVEFETATVEYEYDIHAMSGDVLAYETDGGNATGGGAAAGGQTGMPEQQPLLPEGYKTQTEALAIAYAAAGVAADTVTDAKCKYKEKKGWTIYCIEFEVGEREYEYTVDAQTGEILFSCVEVDDDLDDSPDHDDDFKGDFPDGCITREEAIENALAAAGVTADAAADVDCEKKKYGETFVYDVEFEVGEREYEYYIDAMTGETLDPQTLTGGNHGNGQGGAVEGAPGHSGEGNVGGTVEGTPNQGGEALPPENGEGEVAPMPAPLPEGEVPPVAEDANDTPMPAPEGDNPATGTTEDNEGTVHSPLNGQRNR